MASKLDQEPRRGRGAGDGGSSEDSALGGGPGLPDASPGEAGGGREEAAGDTLVGALLAASDGRVHLPPVHARVRCEKRT